MRRVYLDHNATAPLRPEARAAMLSAMDAVGNPSSVHAEGRAVTGMIEAARGQVAQAVGCKPAEVIFTSGATEAAQTLRCVQPGFDVFVEPTSHDALWVHAKESAWTEAPAGPGHTLALGVANSETGIMTPLPPQQDGQWIYGRARADWLLLDVTQVIGRAPFSFAWSNADFAILSAHKFGGPKGVGALIVRDGVDIDAVQEGGGQEMGRRSGTENVIGIVGMGAAAAAAMSDLERGVWDRVAQLRNILESGVEAASPETILVGKDAERLPNTSCLLTPGWKGETQVITMDLARFAISAGSACSSGKVKASRVLQAMGYGEDDASCAIRVSLGPDTSQADIEAFVDVWSSKRKRQRERAA